MTYTDEKVDLVINKMTQAQYEAAKQAGTLSPSELYITDETMPSKTSDLVNDSGFITASAIPTNISSFTNDVGYLSAVSWSQVSDKPDVALVSQIPTTTASLTNDSGFITASAIPTNISSFNNDVGYLTASDVSTSSITPSSESDVKMEIDADGNLVGKKMINETGVWYVKGVYVGSTQIYNYWTTALPTLNDNILTGWIQDKQGQDAPYQWSVEIPTGTTAKIFGIPYHSLRIQVKKTEENEIPVWVETGWVPMDANNFHIQNVSQLNNDAGYITAAGVPTPDKIQDVNGNAVSADLSFFSKYPDAPWMFAYEWEPAVQYTLTKDELGWAYTPPEPWGDSSKQILIRYRGGNTWDYIQLFWNGSEWQYDTSTEANAPEDAQSLTFAGYGTATRIYTESGTLAKTSELPSKTSDLVNDSGFITASAIPSNVSVFNNDAGYLTPSSSTITEKRDYEDLTYTRHLDYAHPEDIVGFRVIHQYGTETPNTFYCTIFEKLSETEYRWSNENHSNWYKIQLDLSDSEHPTFSFSRSTDNYQFDIPQGATSFTTNYTGSYGTYNINLISEDTLALKNDNISQFRNDSGYITSSQVQPAGVSGYAYRAQGSTEMISQKAFEASSLYPELETLMRGELGWSNNNNGPALRTVQYKVYPWNLSMLAGTTYDPPIEMKYGYYYILYVRGSRRQTLLNGAGWFGSVPNSNTCYLIDKECSKFWVLTRGTTNYSAYTVHTITLASGSLSIETYDGQTGQITCTRVGGMDSVPTYRLLAFADQVPSATSQLTNDSGFITASAIPSQVSAFQNDAGYLTSSSSAFIEKRDKTDLEVVVGTKYPSWYLSELHSGTFNPPLELKWGTYKIGVQTLDGWFGYDDYAQQGYALLPALDMLYWLAKNQDGTYVFAYGEDITLSSDELSIETIATQANQITCTRTSKDGLPDTSSLATLRDLDDFKNINDKRDWWDNSYPATQDSTGRYTIDTFSVVIGSDSYFLDSSSVSSGTVTWKQNNAAYPTITTTDGNNFELHSDASTTGYITMSVLKPGPATGTIGSDNFTVTANFNMSEFAMKDYVDAKIAELRALIQGQ